MTKMRGNNTLHALNAKRKGTTPTNALKNCLWRQIKRSQVYCSDKEIKDKQYEEEEENNSVTSEEYQTENQDKDSTALDDDKTSDDKPYEDNSMSSDKDYEDLRLYKILHVT